MKWPRNGWSEPSMSQSCSNLIHSTDKSLLNGKKKDVFGDQCCAVRKKKKKVLCKFNLKTSCVHPLSAPFFFSFSFCAFMFLCVFLCFYYCLISSYIFTVLEYFLCSFVLFLIYTELSKKNFLTFMKCADLCTCVCFLHLLPLCNLSIRIYTASVCLLFYKEN